MNHLREHADELRDGIEVVRVRITNSHGKNRKKPVLYREGVIKLGFFVRSKQAKVFRQWATEIVVDHMDKNNMSMQDLFEKLDNKFSDIDRRFQETNEIVSGVRTELDDLRELVGTILPHDKMKEAKDLMIQVKKVTKKDGRAVIGHVRKTLGISKPYEYAELSRVINTLRNMLGKGVFGTVEDKE